MYAQKKFDNPLPSVGRIMEERGRASAVDARAPDFCDCWQTGTL
jgi:hypothetical protein